MMNLSGLGVPALAQTHLAEGMVKQIAFPDSRPSMMITRTAALRSLVTIIVRADLPGMNITVQVMR
jgi:hypothetical protein